MCKLQKRQTKNILKRNRSMRRLSDSRIPNSVQFCHVWDYRNRRGISGSNEIWISRDPAIINCINKIIPQFKNNGPGSWDSEIIIARGLGMFRNSIMSYILITTALEFHYYSGFNFGGAIGAFIFEYPATFYQTEIDIFYCTI